MKQPELKPCAACGEGVGHDRSLQFYRLTIQPHLLNLPAIQRQYGLEQMMGNAALAFHMGTQEELAVPVGEPVTILLCQNCGIEPQGVAALLEKTWTERERQDAKQ